jgi:hypothetical protein
MPKKNITELWLKNLKFEKYLATDDAFKHLTAAQKANTKQVDVFDDPAKGGAVYRPLRDARCRCSDVGCAGSGGKGRHSFKFCN